MDTLDENRSCGFADMLEDSCIKRFEYTLEISRKLMKRVLKKIYGKTEEELTVNNVFRFMQGYKFIPNWENWREYYEKKTIQLMNTIWKNHVNSLKLSLIL